MTEEPTTTQQEAKDAAWEVFRNNADWTPSDRYPVRATWEIAFDAAWEARDAEVEALELENAQMVGPGVVANLEAKIHTLESRIAAALEIADGMRSMDRHYGMTIEGRGEVIRAALFGTAVGGESNE